MGRILDLIKESLGDPSRLLKITHTGFSVFHDPHDEMNWQSDSAFTHYRVEHPNGEVQHVSMDYDNNSIIKHKKDPNRPNGACRGSLPASHYKIDDEDHQDNIAMIRKTIAPKTKVRMHK